MAMVDDAVALLKKWQSEKKTVIFSSNGVLNIAAGGNGIISFQGGELTIPLAARTSVDASSVHSVQDGRIAIAFSGLVVTLSTET
ncbi:MAG TPA: hypothetical protein VGQ65_12825 [Thermoanaerobaculia bacterium]|jgi:hypothetical protein|nr:hypothetical protein [Thermoanaerobaculia bacterium]